LKDTRVDAFVAALRYRGANPLTSANQTLELGGEYITKALRYMKLYASRLFWIGERCLRLDLLLPILVLWLV